MWPEKEELHILITNPIPEITNRSSQRRGNKIAMNNVMERLNSHFEGKAKLEHYEKLGSYHVSIVMPIVRGHG